ncbi:dual specificity phosphatase, catalytic domain-containing protein [Hirsutella rhossiliensis]|uniref:protein-tyrosine-phosphatase n=1 Tax=Hirsutella rhossiliensis TaxID=111463 RepID=A0A9P8SJG6_9HYPO|nr:dual specificity phosphatase, catalytic domain-containing protein [Hirsutella rhossiliensis]KAH0963021.1 dual specificity phosphatase, catalytic domain-containing protein [Hirsutella rhossiliensis]
MPSAAARRIYEDQIPSFMSVFDLDAETMADRETVTLVDPSRLAGMEPKAPAALDPPAQPGLGLNAMPSEAAHKHHDSTSTQMSESTDSSPTTTLSTTDSSPLSDPSPSSSPDSPINLIPLGNYPSTTFGCHVPHGTMLSIPEASTLERPMTSPAPRRPRNMKGLSIQPPASLTVASRTLATEPSSPSFTFIKPKIPTMKRKPSQLSLKTSTSDLMTKTSTEMPASPAMPPILHRRALKHSTSSPHMLAGLKSSTFGPPGGMMFPKVLERNESGLSKVLRPMKPAEDVEMDTVVSETESPIKTQLAHRADHEPHDGSVNNEDQKSPGYSDGPVAIYGDDVFLYMEPTAEEASRFDVVINVAREVKNPFDVVQSTQQAFAWLGQSLQTSPPGESPIPDTGLTTASFATAFEFPPLDDKPSETPTTPKAHTFRAPEYIHIPWDHNTNIAPDLMRLCETIESRTREGKKVLVHCQQGASRSASLIIAYGLYRNPDLSLNDAYYAAQAKSRWISPNMKLMYALQDFHKELTEKRLQPTSAYRPRTSRSPTKHRLTLSVDAAEMASKEPRTAPLPGESDRAGNDGSEHSPQRTRGGLTAEANILSSGPASAPLTCTWRDQVQEKPLQPVTSLKLDELPQRPKWDATSFGPCSIMPDAPQESTTSQADQAPVLFSGLDSSSPDRAESENTGSEGDESLERTVIVVSACSDDEALMSPRAETMTNNPLHGFTRVAGMRFVESPATPTAGLFSPRDVMFPRDPFSYFGRPSSFGRPPQVADPRSPPMRGEAPIIRSIDDMI